MRFCTHCSENPLEEVCQRSLEIYQPKQEAEEQCQRQQVSMAGRTGQHRSPALMRETMALAGREY